MKLKELGFKQVVGGDESLFEKVVKVYGNSVEIIIALNHRSKTVRAWALFDGAKHIITLNEELLKAVMDELYGETN